MDTLKYSFRNDYSELAHPRVLEALSAAAAVQIEGYGMDAHSLRAAGQMREVLRAPFADIHFISGGTQANLAAISCALRPYEAVIACDSGHVVEHEAGAIEATGHKVCTTQGVNGKLYAADIEAAAGARASEYRVKPRLVFISQSTEVGSVYTKAELADLSAYCRKNAFYLYLDGARLGTGLASPACDLQYGDLSDLLDAFTIGGTKNGALFGEAVVVCRDDLKTDFRRNMKQKGALLAKGAAIGLQFEALFEDGLFDTLARHANALAMLLADGIRALGYEFAYTPQTNQIFPIFPTEVAEQLHRMYGFFDWQRLGGRTSVRLVTSWATPESAVDGFLQDLADMAERG